VTPRIRDLVIGAACLLAVGVLGAFVAAGFLGDPGPIDAWWSSVAGDMRSPVTESIALGLNVLGRGVVAAVVVPLVAVVVLLLARRPFSALAAVGGATLTFLLTRVLKELFARDRPGDMLVESDFGSFPSGHASAAAVLATVFFLVFPSTVVRVLAVVYIVAMMWSRTLLGAHWLSDVVGGALLGAGVAFVVVGLLHPLLRREPLLRERVVRRKPVGRDEHA
jgi:undecaprenyl-diphosphatase